MPTLELSLHAAAHLPASVAQDLHDIADDALSAAYTRIAQRLKALGYEVSGDVMPGELQDLEQAFRLMVRSMALNNRVISDLNTY